MTSLHSPNPDFDTTGAAPAQVSTSAPVAERAQPVFRWLRRQPLRRNSTDRWLGGVCSAVAGQLGVSASVVRVIVAGLALFAGTGVGIYLLAWVLLPNQDGRILAEDWLRTDGGGTDGEAPGSRA